MNRFEYYKGTSVLPEIRVRNLAVVAFHIPINYLSWLSLIVYPTLPCYHFAFVYKLILLLVDMHLICHGSEWWLQPLNGATSLDYKKTLAKPASEVDFCHFKSTVPKQHSKPFLQWDKRNLNIHLKNWNKQSLSTPLLLTATSIPPPHNHVPGIYYLSKAEVRLLFHDFLSSYNSHLPPHPV